MRLTPATVAREHEWVRQRERVVPLINDTRERLGRAFETTVGTVDAGAYRTEVDAAFADGDLAVNAAALVGLLRDLDCAGDHPGFVVDELLGRELAATIAGSEGRAFSVLAEATFHYADVHNDGQGPAGLDDLDAALAAGFQTRLPGWDWTATENPFAVTPPE
jgi:hypothetical protein